ncbi:HAD-superfamily hydrolase, subfamily IA, variant 3 [Coriobacterium glomerans PW2]|uniref:HAD-superfamily hydrolase, subfamily IA, variant 3 n=1 Tax=Coriobacterium glomerans (strain ATCC 49209 / DSM 20642 / JCM 10262 / PW2) TaxID=700015 RepID=F2N7J9_CORGP|nr:HAD family phosphatase [Coriobacterium glomerans]AEB06815.1 HAD-superfamily hydrolase, subfamily IA, variant 3 [Coriobacterium glomerans PW2]
MLNASLVSFPFKAVIFDMDGVIVDTEAFYLTEQRAFLNDIGAEVSDEELNALVGTSHQEFQRTLVRWWELAGAGRLSIESAQARYHEWARGRVCDYRGLLNPGVHKTLAALKRRGIRVALASSSPLDNIQEVLAACDLTGAFEVTVSGEQFKESKPDPEIYRHTVAALALPVDQCCCIEDSAVGITAGKRAGLTVFAKREERFGFSQAEADAIIDQVSDILSIG